jgi:arylformamidase
MKIHDISLTIAPGMVVWPGDPAVERYRVAKIEEGANANVSHMHLGVHTGTHVDAPYHFLKDGCSVETLALDALIGPVQVVDVGVEVDSLNAAVLQAAGIAEGIERVLFKTRNSMYWQRQEPVFQTDFVAIPADGAAYLVERGIRLVGVDYLSVAPFKNSRPTHEILLQAGMILLEGVDLSNVAAGFYELCCLPMKLLGSDGAPARTVLIER